MRPLEGGMLLVGGLIFEFYCCIVKNSMTLKLQLFTLGNGPFGPCLLVRFCNYSKHVRVTLYTVSSPPRYLTDRF